MHCLIRSTRTAFVMKILQSTLNLVVDIIYLQQLGYEMERTNLSDGYNCFEIGYCGHSASPYANIQLEQATKLILSHFQEGYHSFIYDTIKNKNTQLVCLYFCWKCGYV